MLVGTPFPVKLSAIGALGRELWSGGDTLLTICDSLIAVHQLSVPTSLGGLAGW